MAVAAALLDRSRTFVFPGLGYDAFDTWVTEWVLLRHLYPRKGIGKMRRMMKIVVMVVALLALTAGVALADVVDCSEDISRACFGTDGRDTITGTNARDEIDALGGVDEVDGKGGNDEVYGGPGGEVFIFGRGGSDTLVGGGGQDNIFTTEFPSSSPGVDTVRAGAGNDGIDAVDGFKDLINCGTGDSDLVYFDQGLDEVASNCERQRPR